MLTQGTHPVSPNHLLIICSSQHRNLLHNLLFVPQKHNLLRRLKRLLPLDHPSRRIKPPPQPPYTGSVASSKRP